MLWLVYASAAAAGHQCASLPAARDGRDAQMSDFSPRRDRLLASVDILVIIEAGRQALFGSPKRLGFSKRFTANCPNRNSASHLIAAAPEAASLVGAATAAPAAPNTRNPCAPSSLAARWPPRHRPRSPPSRCNSWRPSRRRPIWSTKASRTRRGKKGPARLRLH